jgi:predicted permease
MPRYFFSELASRLRSLLPGHRPASDANLDDEIAAHLEAATADYLARGFSPAAARREARLRFGNIPQAREHYRDQRGFPFLASVLADLRFAARQFRRTPAFSLVAILMLAAGIGATAAIYSLLDSILLRPLPFADQQQLVKIYGFYPKGWVRAVQQQNHAFASVMSYDLAREHTVASSSGPSRIFASSVTVNAFDVLGLRPQLGRFFLPGEDITGRDNVVLLSDGYWRQNLAANPHVIGQTLRIDGQTRTILGVLPPGIHFPDAATQLWLPVSINPADPIDPWAMFSGQMIARLRPGITPAAAQAELRAQHPHWLKLFPWPMPDSWYADVTVQPLLASLTGDTRPKLLLLFAAVALVLLIACANVAHLMLARAAARSREIAVRSALGATARRLVRQVLTESLLLGIVAGAVGIGLAQLVLTGLKSLLPADTPRLADVGLHAGTLLFIAGLSLGTSLLFGLAPALRLRPRRLQDALKSNATAHSAGREHFRLSGLLVTGQIALATVVILVAGLLLHSLWRLVHVDLGFQTAHLLTARVALDENACAGKDSHLTCANFYGSLLDRLRHTPGVEQAALVSALPMRGFDEGFPFDVEDHPRPARQSPDQGSSRTVSPGYFPLLGIRLLHGRLLNDNDANGTTRAMVINEQMATRYWPGQDPIGKHIEWLGLEAQQGVLDNGAFTVVGVVSNTRHESFDVQSGIEMYTPPAPGILESAMSLVVSTRSDSSAAAAAIRRAVNALNPAAPVYEVQSLATVVDDSAKSQRSLAILMLAFANLAVGVSMAGVYSLVAYMVNCRTREMGIRLALGANRRQLITLVLRQGLVLSIAGAALGLTTAALLGHWLQSFLFATSPLDPLAFLAVPVLLALLAILATWLPAQRAASINPTNALRAE